MAVALDERGVGVMARQPQVLQLTASGRGSPGIQGSVVWDGVAVDRVAELSDVAIPVAEGASITFDGDLPADIFLTAYAESAVRDHSMAATASTSLDPAAPSWIVSLPTGRYLIAVSRTWDDDHSVVDYFTLDVE